MAKQCHHKCEIKAELAIPMSGSYKDHHVRLWCADFRLMAWMWASEEHESKDIVCCLLTRPLQLCCKALGSAAQKLTGVSYRSAAEPCKWWAIHHPRCYIHIHPHNKTSLWSTVPLCRYNRNMGSGRSCRWCRIPSLPRVGFRCARHWWRVNRMNRIGLWNHPMNPH